MVEIVDQLDLSQVVNAYAGTGSRPYHPAMLVALLFYGYATGVFSSRKLAQASHDAIAFRYICANTHPDHRTIADFRKRFLNELAGLFTQVLLIAQAMGLVKLGTVSLDGTKVKANASKRKALSWEHANRLEEQLKGEVEELMRLAEQADNAARPEALDIPQELKRRGQRLEVIAAAKAEIAARAQARFEAEQAEYERKVAAREARAERTGRKPGGKPPKAPTPGPGAKDQVSLTDAESRIMPTAGGGFEQAYNAQAGVDTETHLIVEQHVTDHTNDKQEVVTALARLEALPEVLGEVEALLADTGYHSAANLDHCEAAGVEPYIPEARQCHNPPLAERLADDPPAPEGQPTPAEANAHRLRTRAGKARYAKRKATVETVFGIIKHVLGFRQFLLRGLKAVQGEWALVCLGWNLKRLFALRG
ncbi:transposase [Imhoffiella purpurea]|uniref:Transposase n=1 Tax=Imhoffiella purpurea TaxID=1249627 RepID=W9V4K2_9GAMM|nr:transposase [Imhoffiella purpurea]